MSAYLVMSAIGQDRPGIVDEVSAFVLAHECNVEDSRMAVLGGDFALIMLISGAEAEVEKLSGNLAELEKKSALTIVSRDAKSPSAPRAVPAVPYALKAVGMDHAGIVHNIAHLLAEMGINVETAETATSHSPQTGTPIFSMSMKLAVPGNLQAKQIREQLAKLGDELNVDITIEPAA
ncbi:MAG: glycine cleavage system protein R [Actinobacteria bacterium]|nr:glycine cleavage system protein R [Actinomycetota bacterium]